MKGSLILIVGAGIGGLTAAIALGKRGFEIDLIEKDPEWSVYGVGIIQQANVIRAAAELGIIDDYLRAGFGFDHIEIYKPDGELAAKVTSPKLVDAYPAQLGIGRPALQEVLANRAKLQGANVRLGVVVETVSDHTDGVDVAFSDGTHRRYDLVIGADGIYSQMRKDFFPNSSAPRFAGQAVWRYNFPKPEDLNALCVFEGPVGMGLVPISHDLMYMFVTTPEPDNPRYGRDGIATAMREKLVNAPRRIRNLAEQITDDHAVVYKPLEWHFVDGDWHSGRIVLVGDAVHSTTPHLGQGAGMAIEDGVVLGDELASRQTIEEAFAGYRKRRYERCKYIVESSVAICDGQLGRGPRVNQSEATADMFRVTAAPI